MQTLDEILKECCKVCGIYRCPNHVNWVICKECPSQGKYDLAVHVKCPYCGKPPENLLS
jgi:hypothetical protein